MQVASAIGFSLAPVQNTDMADAAVNPALGVKNGSPGESLFTQLLLNGIAKNNLGKLGEFLPEMLGQEDKGEDGDAAACDISALFAQLFAPNAAVQTNAQPQEAQSGEITAVSADVPSLTPEAGGISLDPAITEQEGSALLGAAGAAKAEAVPESGVTKTKGARPPAETRDFKTVIDESGEKPQTVENKENTADIINEQAAPKMPEQPQSYPTAPVRERPIETAPQAPVQNEERTPELDINDFIGKVTEAAKSMSGEKTGSDTAKEGFTAEKKEAAPIKEAVNDAPVQAARPEFKAETEQVEKAASVEKALGKFAEDLRSVERGVSEIKIVLEPESLGTLTISVAKTENGITARIKSDDKEICGIISGQLGKLISSMESNGVKIEDVDVLFGGSTGQDLGFMQNSQSESRGFAHQQRGYSQQPREKTDGTEMFTKLRDFQGADDGVSRMIEYRI